MMNKEEEKISLIREKLAREQYLDDYLKELNKLTNVEVNESLLISRFNTLNLGAVNKEKHFIKEVLFEDKESLLLFIGDLIKKKDGICYLFTSYSRDCGALKLNSLKEFNVNFKYEDEKEGIIVLMLKDLSNKLILDFYESNGERFLEIETFGIDWAGVGSVPN